MTPTQVRMMLKRKGITVIDLAYDLSISPNTVTKYASGKPVSRGIQAIFDACQNPIPAKKRGTYARK